MAETAFHYQFEGQKHIVLSDYWVATYVYVNKVVGGNVEADGIAAII